MYNLHIAEYAPGSARHQRSWTNHAARDAQREVERAMSDRVKGRRR